MRISGVVLLTACAVAAGSDLTAQDRAHGGGAGTELGRVEFPISCNAEAQAEFERAMALLHSFWWSEAGRAFDGVAAADPDCAMAYWGKAMVARGNWFAGPPSPRGEAAGRAAVARARELGGGTERERGYIAAAAALFGEEEGDYRARAGIYEARMKALHERHPEDAEAAMFHALAVTANATPTDKTFERQKRAGSMLEALFADRPDHPGLAHYIIHTYDAPPIAHMGVDAARRYGGIAPAVPHAQHMPSHVFTRIGMWDESIEANLASAEAARLYEEAEGTEEVSFDRAHAWDYLVYAYLQQGRDADAERMVAEVRRARATPSIATDYAFAAIPARYALERGRWGDAAALEVRPSPGFPAGEAITHFARGIGAARSGDLRGARAEAEALERIEGDLADPYWSQAVRVQRLAVSAWVELGEGSADRALGLIREAADLEELIDKAPVTPGPILPAREMEGDMLMELDRPADALRAYEAALEHEPGRARALAGAARAAEQAGDLEAARERHSELLEVMRNADAGRPEPTAARAFFRRYSIW